jgi:hypothetical protein
MRSGEQRSSGAYCSAPPAAPTGLVTTALPGKGKLEWKPSPASDAVTTYIIEAGSSPGANNQGTFVAPSTSTSFEREAAGGLYYVRMFARNACGTSPASSEVTVAVK